LNFNKNTVQRIFQIRGWQVKQRAIGFRPRVQAMTSLLDCFKHEGGQAVVMVKTQEGQITMAAVNADEHEVNGMVGLMSDALKARSGAMAHGQVN